MWAALWPLPFRVKTSTAKAEKELPMTHSYVINACCAVAASSFRSVPMRSLWAAALAALCLLSASLAVENTYTSLQWSTSQPAPIFHNETFNPTDRLGWLRWGNSFQLVVEPLLNDSINIAAGLVGITDVGNTTTYTVTFQSTPLGALIFNPPSITFQIFTTQGATGSLSGGGAVTGGGSWWFTPTGSISVQVTAASQAHLDTLDFSPFGWWEFNYTHTPPLRPLVSVEINATLSCATKGSSCGTEAVVLTDGRHLVTIDERPLMLVDPDINKSYYVDPYIDGDLSREIPITDDVTEPNAADSRTLVVTLPLETPDFVDFTLLGSPYSSNVSYFQPGRDNFGGALTISLHSCAAVIENDTAMMTFENVSRQPTMTPSQVVISSLAPTASFKFTTIPWLLSEFPGFHVEQWLCSFRVVESVVGYNAALSLDDAPTFWPQGAYVMPSVSLVYDPVDISFMQDLTLTSDSMTELMFISPRKTGSYRYTIAIERSPADLLLGETGTVTLAFTISPPGAISILVATSVNPTSFAPVDAFVWTGYQRTIEFIINTQETPSDALGVNWTFSDPVTAPLPIDPSAFAYPSLVRFSVVPNLMSVALANSAGGPVEDGITPNQPFWLSFLWSPPTTSGFVITLQSFGLLYPDGTSTGNITFNIGSGQTGYLAGPFVAFEPTSLGPSVDDTLAIPINIGLSSSSGLADSSWYYINTPVFVRVRRDRVYLVNNPIVSSLIQPDKRAPLIDPTVESQYLYELSAGGFVSEKFCVGVSLNSHFFQNSQEEIWVTPWAETIAGFDTSAAAQFANRSGLLFNALDVPAAAPGVSRAGIPPGTVVLNRANNGTGCFTIAFDRNWQFLSTPLSSGADALHDFFGNDEEWNNRIGLWRVQAAIGGPNRNLVYEERQSDDVALPFSTVLRIPNYFTVRVPKVLWSVLPEELREPSGDWDVELLAGETAMVYVSLSEPAQLGLNYALTCTACVFEQINVTTVSDLPGFATGSIGPHLWRVTVNALPTSFILPEKRALNYATFTTTLRLWTHGSDAAYFEEPNTVTVALIPRIVYTDMVSETIPVGSSAGPYKAHITNPVENGFSLVPVPEAGAPLVFDPPQLDFVPNGDVMQYFSVGLDETIAPFQLGTWHWSWRLTGPDANITVVDSSFSSVQWVRRDAPLITVSLPDELMMGESKGPLDILLQQPLLLGESELTLTPHGRGMTFTPASITFLPLQAQHTCSVRIDPVPGAPFNQESLVFWSVGGSEAWKYEVPPTTSLARHTRITLRPVVVELGDVDGYTTVVVGQRYDGLVSLPLPTPSNVQFSLFADGVSFEPPMVNFTSNSGILQRFTFTISPGFPYHADGDFEMTILVSVSGADKAYYEVSPVTVTVEGRTFQTVNPITENDLFILNQPSSLYTWTAVGAPQNDVSITFSSDYITFTPATLTFSVGETVQSFYFTPVAVPPMELGNNSMHLVSYVVSGADAHLYSTAAVDEFFSALRILPEIDVSPLPALYTDTSSEEIWVSLKSNRRLVNGLPSGVASFNAFTITVVAWDTPEFDGPPRARRLAGGPRPAVYIEPSVLEFSSSSQTALRSFRIHHVSPARLIARDQYYLAYYLRSAGNPGNGIVINQWLPAHAQTVPLQRYQIVPSFPKVLAYSWEYASFNLTRPCVAPLTITPMMPIGLDGTHINSGHQVAAGRVHFDPPVITFAPGQTVATFLVKAARGVEDGHGYYRVEYAISGNDDDLANFKQAYWGNLVTYHMASATATQACLPILLSLLALLLCYV